MARHGKAWPALAVTLLRAAFLGVMASGLAAPAAGQETPAPPGPVPRPAVPGPEAPGLLRLANRYVQVTLNASPDAGGRFTIQTTGGNPERTDDDDKPLLYGGDEPWTSFTTVRVGERDYVFGTPTLRPAGRGGMFGQPLFAPRLTPDGSALEAGWRFGPGVEVIQRLRLVRGLTTGLMDTVRIEYVITNRADLPQRVGLRVVLDTMAGSNDGAPFRVGEQAVEADTALASPAQLPDFWQVFDSLTQPAVIAQGTLKGEGLTPPDRVYFTNWGVLRDSLWDFDFQPGRSFERQGELELDSAVALFFDPVVLAPGQQRVVATAYGLGGVSIVPGQLAVGLSGPEWAEVGQARPVTLVAYVQNTGPGSARDLRVSLQLPAELVPAPGEILERELGELPVGRVAQASWRVLARGPGGGPVTYRVRAEAENAPPNQASRSLRLVSPARVQVRLSGPQAVRVERGRWVGVPFRLEAELTNEGGAPARGVWVRFNSPVLEVAPGDSPDRYVGRLEPGEKYRVGWLVRPKAAGPLPWSARVYVAGVGELQVPTATVHVPALAPAVWLREALPGPSAGRPLRPGEPFHVAVELASAAGGASVEVELAFDPRVLRLAAGPLGVDPGSAVAVTTGPQVAVSRPEPTGPSAAGPEGPRLAVQLDQARGRLVLRLQLPPGRAWEQGTVAIVRLVAQGEGSSSVQLVRATYEDASGRRALVEPGGRGGPPGLSVTVGGARESKGPGSAGPAG